MTVTGDRSAFVRVIWRMCAGDNDVVHAFYAGIFGVCSFIASSPACDASSPSSRGLSLVSFSPLPTELDRASVKAITGGDRSEREDLLRPEGAASPGGCLRRVFELGDIKFHSCVRLSQFERDRSITFLAPDGESIWCGIIRPRGSNRSSVSIRR
jgi:hypothetical protein